MKFSEIETFFGFTLASLVAGLMGALIQLLLNPKLSIPGRIISVIGGTFCAVYFGQVIGYLVIQKLGAADPKFALQLALASVFLTGVLGMEILGKIYQGIARIDAATVKDWAVALLRRIIGK